MIFTKSSAIRLLQHSFTQNSPNTDDENELDNNYLHGGIYVNLDDDDDKEEDNLRIERERITCNGKRTIRQGKSIGPFNCDMLFKHGLIYLS